MSKFKELHVRFNKGASDAVTPENWRNTVHLSLGAVYKTNGDWTLHGGVAYENSAIPDVFRTARIPDNAHTSHAVEANYRISKVNSFEFGYVHAFVKEAGVNNSVPGMGQLIGTFSVQVDMLSVQYNRSF